MIKYVPSRAMVVIGILYLWMEQTGACKEWDTCERWASGQAGPMVRGWLARASFIILYF
jgi:hypothetical protein